MASDTRREQSRISSISTYLHIIYLFRSHTSHISAAVHHVPSTHDAHTAADTHFGPGVSPVVDVPGKWGDACHEVVGEYDEEGKDLPDTLELTVL